MGLVAFAFPISWGDPASTAAGRGASPSSDFSDVFSADLAGDADGLSLAVAGQARRGRRGDLVVRVYRRGRRSGWQRAARLGRPLDPGASVSLVQTRGRPCVGYQARRHARFLGCLSGSSWRSLPSAGLPPRPAQLTKLADFNDGLTAVFRARRQVIVVRLAGDRWRRLGQPIPANGAIPAIGEGYGAEPALDLALVDVAEGARFLWSLSDGRWRARTPLRDVGGGPMPTGPVRLGSRLYLPVIDASAEPWQFSVYLLDGENWTRLGGPLNRGAGTAQGVIRVNRGSVWAAWQENALRDDGRFDTHMYVRRVAPTSGRARKVWAGTSIGPGSIESVQGAGRQWVLYMPRARGRTGLTVAVKPLR
jgi:hypothetical protein